MPNSCRRLRHVRRQLTDSFKVVGSPKATATFPSHPLALHNFVWYKSLSRGKYMPRSSSIVFAEKHNVLV